MLQSEAPLTLCTDEVQLARSFPKSHRTSRQSIGIASDRLISEGSSRDGIVVVARYSGTNDQVLFRPGRSRSCLCRDNEGMDGEAVSEDRE